jgi:hypothetical protein
MAGNDVQSNVGHEIQKQNTDLINSHAAIVQGIELSRRQTKPAPMQPKHPIMGQVEGYEPQEQDQIVQDSAPEEKISEWKVIHGVSRHDS